MTPENTQKLFDAFPRLYRGRVKSLQESLMAFGFCCGDGWFDLIWTLSQTIEYMARQEGRDPYDDAWPEAMQVKEKTGSLRFRLRKKSVSMALVIQNAEAASARTCELCGRPGSRVGGSGIETLCPEHAQARSTEPSSVPKKPV